MRSDQKTQRLGPYERSTCPRPVPDKGQSDYQNFCNAVLVVGEPPQFHLRDAATP